MKEFLKKGIMFAIAGIVTSAILSASVYAADVDFFNDASGNLFAAGQTVSVSALSDLTIDNELFMAGMDVNANDADVDGSGFMAGQNVSAKNSSFGGSIFAVGNNVTIDAEVRNNIWVAGNIISIGDGTSVKGLHIVGNVINVSGTYDSANVCGSHVTIDAVINGDLEVEAEEVNFTENAKVLGNLTVKSKEDPGASDIAEGTYTFEVIENDKSDNASAEVDADGNLSFDKSAIKGAGKLAAGAIILKKIKNCFLNLFRFALLAVIFVALFKKNLNDAYEFATKRALPFWCIGAAITIFFPLLAIICAITIIGLPVAGLATTIYILALAFARVFAFGSLVRELIFRHTAKRLHPIAETVLAVLPAAVIKEIPFIGGFVGFACAIYTIGYICLAIADTISANKEPKKAEASETVEVAESSSVADDEKTVE